MKLAESRKFLVALLGILATFIAHQWADESWLTAALAALDALAVYLVPNDVTPTQVAKYAAKTGQDHS